MYMAMEHSGLPAGEPFAPAPAQPLTGLVNRLAQELADVQRAHAAANAKLLKANRALEVRNRELTETRAVHVLLLATLDVASEGIVAVAHFGGRAMHCNSRFVQMWRIAPDKLSALNESALLAMQLSQVKDPAAFLALFERRTSQPDAEQASVVELTDGRVLHYQTLPLRLNGKRVGRVTRFHDTTT
jgi:hypothetical protein